MDSMYHSTVMHRPAHDDHDDDDHDDRLRRDRPIMDTASNGNHNHPAGLSIANAPSGPPHISPHGGHASSSSSTARPFDARSPTQSDFHPPPPPFSPSNGHPRPHFNNPYHPPTPAPLPMPAPSHAHLSGPPASPRVVTAPPAYASEYPPAPRDKPTTSYYDPTSDSSDRRPAEGSSWHHSQSRTPQVRRSSRPPGTPPSTTFTPTDFFPAARALPRISCRR